MEGWALRASADRETVVAALRDALTANGYRLVGKRDRGARQARVFAHDDATLVLVEHDIPDRALALAIHGRVAAACSYLELRLDDAAVTGSITELPDGVPRDVDEDALEILNDWNEGENRKFLSESFAPLVEALLDVPEGARPATIWFVSSASPRVAALVRAIHEGGRWERTELGGRAAIRIHGKSGAQISVLSPDEEAELAAQLARK